VQALSGIFFTCAAKITPQHQTSRISRRKRVTLSLLLQLARDSSGADQLQEETR
jgi:hypothetical protein